MIAIRAAIAKRRTFAVRLGELVLVASLVAGCASRHSDPAVPTTTTTTQVVLPASVDLNVVKARFGSQTSSPDMWAASICYIMDQWQSLLGERTAAFGKLGANPDRELLKQDLIAYLVDAQSLASQVENNILGLGLPDAQDGSKDVAARVFQGVETARNGLDQALAAARALDTSNGDTMAQSIQEIASLLDFSEGLVRGVLHVEFDRKTELDLAFGNQTTCKRIVEGDGLFGSSSIQQP